MSPQMGVVTDADLAAAVAAEALLRAAADLAEAAARLAADLAHAALTITHGTVDDIADQTDIATHAALTVIHGTVDDIADQTDIATHAALPNAHHAQVHGAAQHTDVTRELFIPACEGYIASGARAGRQSYGVVSGGANANEPLAYFSIKVPDDFVSFTSVKAVWASTPAAGDMYWYLTAHYAAGGEADDTHAEAPALAVTATGGAFIINVQEPGNPLTLVNLALGDYLGLKFYRQGTNVLDTLDNAALLYGLLFTYVASQ